MINRWEWLKLRLIEIESNPSRFAKDIGWQASRVYELFSGKTKAIPLDKVAKAATLLGIPLNNMLDFNTGFTNQVKFISKEEQDEQAGSTISEIDIFEDKFTDNSAFHENQALYNGPRLGDKKVLSTWRFPDSYLNELKIQNSTTFILEVVGDSMSPTINSGDRVVIDTSLKGKKPSPSGVFAIWDGVGAEIKRLELIPNTIPQRVNIFSDNPTHISCERKMSECCIVGRIVSVIKKL